MVLVERINSVVGEFSSRTSSIDFCLWLVGGVNDVGDALLGTGTKVKCSIVSFGKSFSIIAKQ